MPVTKMQKLAMEVKLEKMEALANEKFDSEKVGMYSHRVPD